MKRRTLSTPLRSALALALLVCLGLAYVAGLLSSPMGMPARIGTLWDREWSASRSPTAGSAAPVALKKGLAGFDFTRIGRSGNVLARQDAMWRDAGSEAEGTQWDCLRDNVSGLWWEAKTQAEANGVKHLRHMDHTYSGSGSTQRFGARCSGLPDAGGCNTQAYVDAVNTAGLCGFHDWRLPSVAELKPLTSINKGGATIDVDQFPHTAPTGYWTASAYPHRKNYAWYVYFAGAGDAFGDATSANYAIRLVRNGQ